jgi:hypothetical protein
MEQKNDSRENHHDHYSMDDMMERLKGQKREEGKDMKDGELVTRADGTQVVKVRKRKRRSKQAPKETNPRSKWAAIGITIGLAVFSVVFTIFIITKYNGASFKEKTEMGITRLLEADLTKLTQLRVTPVSATANQAVISWGSDSFFNAAAFSKIKTDIRATSFFSDSWRGNEILAEKGVIELQMPAQNRPQTIANTITNYRFSSYRCAALDIIFGAYNPSISIKGIHATLQQLPSRQYQVSFNNGTINIPYWPELTISSGIASLRSSNTEIEARLKAANNHKGELTIKGIVYKDKEQPIVLDVKSTNYPLEDILGKDLGQIVKGEINSDMGSLTLDNDKNEQNGISLIIPFNSNQLHISKLPILNDLRDLTGKSNYLHPSFTYCRGSVIRSGNGVSLENLKLISSQLLTIEGNIAMGNEGALSGNLKIGIPSRLFDNKNPAPRIFSAPVDGNIYTTVKLSGTTHNPHDDFNASLQQSNATIISKPPTYDDSAIPSPLELQGESKQKEKAFEELTQ